jgi:hypothetical protein
VLITTFAFVTTISIVAQVSKKQFGHLIRNDVARRSPGNRSATPKSPLPRDEYHSPGWEQAALQGEAALQASGSGGGRPKNLLPAFTGTPVYMNRPASLSLSPLPSPPSIAASVAAHTATPTAYATANGASVNVCTCDYTKRVDDAKVEKGASNATGSRRGGIGGFKHRSSCPRYSTSKRQKTEP